VVAAFDAAGLAVDLGSEQRWRSRKANSWRFGVVPSFLPCRTWLEEKVGALCDDEVPSLLGAQIVMRGTKA
jgi:hypothetical protein